MSAARQDRRSRWGPPQWAGDTRRNRGGCHDCAVRRCFWRGLRLGSTLAGASRRCFGRLLGHGLSSCLFRTTGGPVSLEALGNGLALFGRHRAPAPRPFRTGSFPGGWSLCGRPGYCLLRRSCRASGTPAAPAGRWRQIRKCRMNGRHLLLDLPQALGRAKAQESSCLIGTHVVGHTFLLTKASFCMLSRSS